MSLSYDGFLSRDETDWCLDVMDTYAFAIEVSKLPDREVLSSALKTRKWAKMADSGVGDYVLEREGALYGIVQKNFLTARNDQGQFVGGGFLFFVDLEDYEAAVSMLGDTVVDPSPFKTALERS